MSTMKLSLGFKVLLFVSLVGSANPGTMCAVAAASSVRVMSFNIRFDNGTPSSAANAWISTTGTNRRDLVLDVVHDYMPDIMGVQEALPNQMNDLQNNLVDYAFSGVGRDNGVDRGEFSAIFYRVDRFTPVDEGTFWLSNTPDVPSFFPGTCCRRIASWVVLNDIEKDNEELFVLNTHWDHQVQAARVLSSEIVREKIEELRGERPLIVMGDLNANTTNDAFMELVGDNDPAGLQLLDSYREVVPVIARHEATFHGFSGSISGRRIDFVLHDDSWRAVDAQIVRTRIGGRFPSDHYPVTATLQRVPEPDTTITLYFTVLFVLSVRKWGPRVGASLPV